MSTNRNQKAYIRIDGSGRDVAGSLILRNKKPGNGKWREILAYECCNFDPTPTTTTTSTSGTPTTTTTTSIIPLNVGTFYQGGIIASTSIIDNQMMIVSLEYLGNLLWYNGTSIITGATATGLKTGSANTDTIISVQGAGTYAATKTRDNILPWGLPSKDELNQVYVNRTVINTGIANSGGDQIDVNISYWSSTENDLLRSWEQSFNNGGQYLGSKNAPNNVRAVRWVNI
jgi:hypothetical protein